MKLVTASQMQALDRRAIQEAKIPSLTLMERAGAATVAEIRRLFGTLKGKRIVILCGKGHNGGDGLVVARLLAQRETDVRVLLLHPLAELAPDTRTMHRRLVRKVGARAVTTWTSLAQLNRHLATADLIVDALLGTGLSSAVKGRYAETIQAINACGRPIVAVDLPSGLHADTGARLGAVVRATLTVTFAFPKYGLYLEAGIDHAGTIRVVDIGIPRAYEAGIETPASLLTADDVSPLIPPRPPSAHKGTFGHAGIIAGSIGKTGAAILAAKAALRVGTGLVTVATPASVNATIEGALIEAMTYPVPGTSEHTFSLADMDPLLRFAGSKTALAIGPGVGAHSETVQLIQRLLQHVTVPCVVDADGLNAVSSLPSVWARCKAPMILTPHPGEMARLTGKESGHAVNCDRLDIARTFARKHGVTVVLKGARTVLASPDGRLAINPTGNAGMATGGTGDVLTGMIAGLLAQGLLPWDAACAATFLHGLAGDLAAAAKGQAGLIAGDLIEHIPDAFVAITS